MKYSAGHRWYPIERRPRPWWILERSRRTGESELVQGPGLVEGASYECADCGTVRVFARFADEEGVAYEVALYGFDLDALSPTRAPPCEVFARPLPADAPALVEASPAAWRPFDALLQAVNAAAALAVCGPSPDASSPATDRHPHHGDPS